MNVFDEVKKVLAGELSVKPEQVKLESKLNDDLGADSLDAAEVVLALEEKFAIEIPDEEAREVATVGDIVELVNQKLRAKTAANPS